MIKPFIEFTPQELDALLREKYNANLPLFAMPLWGVLKTRGPYAQDVLDFKKRTAALKGKAIKLIADYESTIKRGFNIGRREFYRDHPDDFEKQIVEKYKLKDFFSIGEVKGMFHPGGERNKINFFWSEIIKTGNGSIDWKLIADLFDWFWEKLKAYECYKELNPKNVSADPEYLKNQYYKFRKRKTFYYDETKWKSFANVDGKKLLDKIQGVFWPFFKECSFIFSEKDAGPVHSDTVKSSFKKYSQQVICDSEKILAKKIDYRRLPVRSVFRAYMYYAGKLFEKNPQSSTIFIFPDLSYLIY